MEMKNFVKGNLLLLLVLFSTSIYSQPLVDFFKYSTLYMTGFASQPYQSTYNQYEVGQWDRTIYDITPENPFNYSYSIGLRKIGRFGYENKPNRFYDGTEVQQGLNSNVGSTTGWEYLFHNEWARTLGVEYNVENYFIRHLGEHNIVKFERLNNGFVDLKYNALDLRYRLPVGSKWNFSAGVIGRTHRAYGYDPVMSYIDTIGTWYTLAYEYGYTDHAFTQIIDGDTITEWYWSDPDGNRITDTDGEFRRTIFNDIANHYNDTVLAGIGMMGTISAVIGVDFYHNTDDFWVHTWLSFIPYHYHIFGDRQYSYLSFNDGLQWVDHQGGIVMGWYITNRLGIYLEGNKQLFWDRNIYSGKVGLNYRL